MFDRQRLTTYPIRSRPSLESLKDHEVAPIEDPISTPEFLELVDRIKKAKAANKPIILFMGGHVVKTGCSQYIIDLIKRGFITHIATNGSGSIHDFEIAFEGETSEDVEKALEDGTYGLVEETGREINAAIIKDPSAGYGYQVGKAIDESDLPNKEHSIQYTCYKYDIPFTVHKTIGTDIIDMHPKANYAALGEASGVDFLKFVHSVCQLGGGVILNVGCAVTGPEVFLKAISMATNAGHDIFNKTTANFDQLPHYRPRVNIVQRPTAHHPDAKGFDFSGKDENGRPYLHQRTIPSLWMHLTK